VDWLMEHLGLQDVAARQIAEYLARRRRAGRAADARYAGDGALLRRIGRHAAGGAFAVRQPHEPGVGTGAAQALLPHLQFELQAAATEDAIVLSLSDSHSFPLDEVWRYLRSNTAEHVLVQALLDAPLFNVRWRWNATALALPRFAGGRRSRRYSA
jgi:ATP-dependent Lhr-like helicase